MQCPRALLLYTSSALWLPDSQLAIHERQDGIHPQTNSWWRAVKFQVSYLSNTSVKRFRCHSDFICISLFPPSITDYNAVIRRLCDKMTAETWQDDLRGIMKARSPSFAIFGHAQIINLSIIFNCNLQDKPKPKRTLFFKGDVCGCCCACCLRSACCCASCIRSSALLSLLAVNFRFRL